MPSDALARWLAGRRDALLLVGLMGGTLAWTWARGTVVVLGGALVCAVLFGQALATAREGLAAGRVLHGTSGVALGGWPVALLALSGVPLTLLVARAAWLAVGSPLLTALLVLLTISWQMWLFFWMTTSEFVEAQDGRVERLDRGPGPGGDDPADASRAGGPSA